MVNFFIERPIFAASVAIIMVLAGLICYPLLPVAQFPEVTPPLVVVSATYPGASAQVVADTVTTPLEQQINGVPGMIYMSSTSANDGSSNITVSFDVGYPIDIAAVDVQNRVSAATAQLPAIVNQGGVTVQKKNPNLTLAVNLYSPDGSVDLVIGTHRLLSKDVKFRDLGLVVVDEEQRFGVAAKERLKQLRREVDVLTLSAAKR